MPDYFEPNLTGVDPAYRVDTYQRIVHRANQHLLFEVPVFYNDLFEVLLLGTVTEPMVESFDWVVNPEDIDVDAISSMKVIDPNFSGILLKSVTIIKPFTNEYKVQVKFNQLFADVVNYANLNRHNHIEVTPTLIGNMLEKINYMNQMVLTSSGKFSDQSTDAKIVEIDRTGNKPSNLITDESHDIDSINDRIHIRPIYGSFYHDSMEIFLVNTGEVFTEDEDYEILEADLAKTANSTDHGGVYNTVKILREMVGEVRITYQAYGGSADVVSVRNIHDRVDILEAFLSANSFITPSTLVADPLMIDLQNKLHEMEGIMRLLLQNGMPSYGDVSTNSSVLKKIVAIDVEPHWWSLATLYRVDGSASDVLADVFKFRIKTLYSKMMFECSVSIDVSPGASNPIMVTCDNANIPDRALELITPKLRMLQVNGGVYSGVVLQLGMKLETGVLQESFAIEDMSGKESCWKLVPFTENSINPEDTEVLMPNGSAIYTVGDELGVVVVADIPFPDGLNVLMSDANVPLVFTEINTPLIVNIETDQTIDTLSDVDIATIKAFNVTAVLDIADLVHTEMEIIANVVSRNPSEGRVRGVADIRLDDVEIKFIVEISILDNISVVYAVQKMEDAIVSTTINVSETKILF